MRFFIKKEGEKTPFREVSPLSNTLFLLYKADLIGKRQCKSKLCAFAFFTEDLNALTMIYDDLLHNRKPQSHTGLIQAAGFVSLMEAFENMPDGLFIHTDSGILNAAFRLIISLDIVMESPSLVNLIALSIRL